jgi:Spx/MgsR family transcriptional regulator
MPDHRARRPGDAARISRTRQWRYDRRPRETLEAQRMTTIYGIKSCDTMRKAQAWLDEHGVPYAFHDYKKSGIDLARLERWSRIVGWKTLLNRAGTTFRRLPAADTARLDESRALRLLVEHPSMIKRPVLERDGRVVVGFEPEIYARLLQR